MWGATHTINDLGVFAINEIQTEAGFNAVGLDKCDNKKVKTNKWTQFICFWIEYYWRPILLWMRWVFFRVQEWLRYLLWHLKWWYKIVPTLFSRGRLMLERINTLNKQLTKLDLLCHSFEEKYLKKKNDKAEEEEQKGTLGGSDKKPATNCVSIRKAYEFKKSGYYWLKPGCAKNPMRVFCDY